MNGFVEIYGVTRNDRRRDVEILGELTVERDITIQFWRLTLMDM